MNDILATRYLLPHLVDELVWQEVLIQRLGELFGGAVEGTAEAVADRQQARYKGGDWGMQALAFGGK